MTKKELTEKGAKLQNTRNSVYFAMTFISSWLDVNANLEQQDELQANYFGELRNCLVELDNVREDLDLRIKLIKGLLKREANNGTKK